jgi:hypothetical protein
MTKKDLQTIARAMHLSRPWEVNYDSGTEEFYTSPKIESQRWMISHQWIDCAQALCTALELDNPRFSPSLFREACATGTCKGMRK